MNSTQEAFRLNAHLRALFDSTGEGIYAVDVQGNCTFVNRAGAQMLGYTPEELLGQNMHALTHHSRPDGSPYLDEECPIYQAFRGGQGCRVAEEVFWHRNGAPIPVEYSFYPISDGETIQGAVVTLLDITERKQAEDAMARLASIVESSQDAIISKTPDGIITSWNAAAERLWGYTAGEAVGQSFSMLIPPGSEEAAQGIQQRIHAGKGIASYAAECRRKDGTLVPISVSISPIRDASGRITAVSVIGRDRTEHKRAEEQLRRQFERLIALRAIDAAILGNLDLHITLNLIVEQAIAGLGCHAARILLLTPDMCMLEFAAGKGFASSLGTRCGLRLGEGYAGRAALDWLPVIVPDLRTEAAISGCSDLIAAEGFVEYCAVPLIVKGGVQGVLEIFGREPRARDAEWQDYLETLAGQAAIAIDNDTLFNNLQRTHAELVMAYDATLEGWVQALDLRDKETEGHTLRVTEMTVRLAKAMGFPAEELTHVRRGALLHDIGKLGIPDCILLNPGPLTEAERQTMRLHPVYAYNWLSSIRFLRPALDIPYSHHEKWDGTGYPLGLKGEQIPLPARLFAVVDVWDALRSDRPYRQAWPEEKALAYIRDLSGIHFDPAVVEVFLKVIAGDGEKTMDKAA